MHEVASAWIQNIRDLLVVSVFLPLLLVLHFHRHNQTSSECGMQEHIREEHSLENEVVIGTAVPALCEGRSFKEEH